MQLRKELNSLHSLHGESEEASASLHREVTELRSKMSALQNEMQAKEGE